MYKTGFIHIFGSSVINKVLSVASGFVLIRLLSVEAYGAYSYAVTIFSVFSLFSGMGIGSAILQMCSEEKIDSRRKKIFSCGFYAAIAVNILLSVFYYLYIEFGPIETDEARLLSYYFIPLFFMSIIFDLILDYFRFSFKNKEFSYLTTINTISNSCGTLVGAFTYGAVGLILGKSISLVITIFLGRTIYMLKLPGFIKKNDLFFLLKKMIPLSGISLVNIATGQLITLIDVLIVAQVIADNYLISMYKVASIIPTALLFLPASLMTYYFPLFSRNRGNVVWVKNEYRKIVIYFGTFNIVLAGFIIMFSKPLICIFFGEQYMGMQDIFHILILSYVFSATFRKITGNILVTEHKLKINFYIGLVELFTNIPLSYFLVVNYGTMGAAISTLLVTVFSAILGIIYLRVYLNYCSRQVKL